MSYHGNYHVFEPRPGELACGALKDLGGAFPVADRSARLMFERWDPALGFESDAHLNNLELDRHGGGQPHA